MYRNQAGSLLLAVGACLALLTSTVLADQPSDQQGTAKFEIRFLEGMIDHHHMAVMMSELCDGRTIHGELQGLCEQIVSTQTAEIEQMQSWLMQWYGLTHEPEMKAGMENTIYRLSALTGEAFEIEYMQMMIRHHEAAIREAGHCLERAEHEELLAMCESMRQAQEEEVSQLEGWLCDWYEICR